VDVTVQKRGGEVVPLLGDSHTDSKRGLVGVAEDTRQDVRVGNRGRLRGGKC
jgi:hypothetical protein